VDALPGHERLIAALDVATTGEAVALAKRLTGAVGMLKVGMRLFTAAGAEGLGHVARESEVPIFLDLKFHDIPNTVADAVEEAAALGGVGMINVHALGGLRMMKAAAERLQKVTDASGGHKPLLIAVTVLTSMTADEFATVGVNESPADAVRRLAALAQRAGLDGVVASPQEIGLIRAECGPDFKIVTPGIRMPDDPADDQRRTRTPAEAVAQGADYLVIGRPIRNAPDPRAAAERILASIG